MLFPEPNNPPAITFAPIETAILGEIYTCTVSEKGDRLLFRKKPVSFFNLNNLSFKQY